MSERREAEETNDLERLIRLMDKLLGEVSHIRRVLDQEAEEPATGFAIKQTGETMATNNTIVAGQVGTFTAVTIPTGGALQAGSVPVWSSSDALTTLTADPTGLNVAVATSLSDTAASFTLTITGVNSAGATITGSVTVTLTAPATLPATGFAVSQVS